MTTVAVDKMSFVRSKKGIILIVTLVISVIVGLTIYFTLFHNKSLETIKLPSNPLLASTDDGRIVQIDWWKKQYTTVVDENPFNITCFDYSVKYQMLFYATDNPDDPIKTWNGEYGHLIESRYWMKKIAISVDDANDKLYLLEGYDQVWVFDMKSDYFARVINLIPSQAIAVDPIGRFLLMQDLRTIYIIGIDGSYNDFRVRARIIDDVNAFAVDQSTGMLYLAFDNFVASVNTVGTKKFVLPTNENITSLTFRMNRLFYITHPQYSVLNRNFRVCEFSSELKKCVSYQKINGTNDDVLLTSKLVQIKSYRNVPQNFENPCDIDNGGCQHLCIFYQAPTNYRCMCNDGWKLAKDRSTCYKA